MSSAVARQDHAGDAGTLGTPQQRTQVSWISDAGHHDEEGVSGRPGAQALEVNRFDLSALTMITDCDLGPEDLGRLLGTFPGCTFLLTSHRRTLAYDAGTALEVDRSGLQRFARVYHAARQCPQLEPVRLFHQQHTIALDEEGERGKMGRPRWCPDCHPPGLPRAALVQEVPG